MAGMKHGAWCHIEIPTASIEAAKRFYGGVFGWTFTYVPEMKYTLYSAGEGEIAGGLFDPPPGTPRHITNYINVTDLEASAGKVAELGGRIVTDRMEVPGHGFFRVVLDPDGNALSLWQSLAPAAPEKETPASRKKTARKAVGRAKRKR